MMLDGCEEGWLDDFMQTPELSLAEKLEQNGVDLLADAEALLKRLEVIYERIKPLVELADSNPNYRLAVVEHEPIEEPMGDSPRPICPGFSTWSWNDGWTACEESLFEKQYRRVVKMEER